MLDGYRAIAILLVLLDHSFGDGLTDQVPSLLYAVCKKMSLLGWCGVDAFFVLSGFLITGILLDTREQPHYFRNFYARRLLRIFPVYYVTLLILFVLLYPVLSGYEFYDRLESYQAWYWLYLENWEWTFHPRFEISPIAHFWSLAVEEQFYLLWPLIVYLVPRRFLGWLVGILILCPAIVRNAILLTHPFTDSLSQIFYYNSLSRVDALACGAAIALLMRSDRWRTLLLRLCPLVAILSSSILGIIWVIQPEGLRAGQPVVPSIGYSLLAICFGSLLVSSLAAAETHPLVRFLNWSPLRKLGRISYGFYVYHLPIMFILRHLLPVEIHNSYLLGDLLMLFCCGFLTLMASLLSWHCLEQPILKLKRYFPTRLLPEDRSQTS
ncbi:MAG: acyltransferase [Hormoscilla sp. GM7CHS1pb]|nr:acyltransferase [Hormoscilla sp. GM7CHS1pb]